VRGSRARLPGQALPSLALTETNKEQDIQTDTGKDNKSPWRELHKMCRKQNRSLEIISDGQRSFNGAANYYNFYIVMVYA